MKPLLSILFVVICPFLNGQTSFSLGFSKVNEHFSYPTYSTQVAHDFAKFRVYAEIGYFEKSFEINAYNEFSYGKAYKEFNYSSKVHFSYVNYKIGFGKQFRLDYKNKVWNSISLNFFGKFEDVVNFKVSDQVTDQLAFYYGNSAGNYNQVIGIEHFPPDYSPFEIVGIRNNILRVGFDLKIRAGYKNIFVEFNSSMCSPINDRIYLTNTYREHDFPIGAASLLNSTLHIGYTFSRKDKPIIKE